MMDEKETVKLFLDRGFQLSKDALPYVSENPEMILKNLNMVSPRPFIITSDHVKKILQKHEVPRVKIIKEIHPIHKSITVEEYFKDLLNVFEKIQNIISNNSLLDKLISINKITEKTNEFSVIGMVKEKVGTSLILEDPTGQIQLYCNDDMKMKADDVDIDDIVGVKCRRVDAKYYMMQIVFSEIPFQVDVKRSPKEFFLVFSLSDNLEILKNYNSEATITFSLPNDSNKLSFIDISGVKIIIIPKNSFKEEKKSDVLLKILRKRIISKLAVTPSSYLFIEEVPHIILSNLTPTVYKNYKGTSIISNDDENKVFVINLKTREVVENII